MKTFRADVPRHETKIVMHREGGLEGLRQLPVICASESGSQVSNGRIYRKR